ncbi:hypothetical protein MXB_1909, partial [Myxobolus squamalis]
MIDGKPALLVLNLLKKSSLQDGYIRQGNMYVLVFALDSPQSLMELKGYVDNVKLSLVVGNKCDIPSTISPNDLESVKAQLNLPYIETSAKIAKNV